MSAQPLEATLTDLASGVMNAAGDAPIAVEEIFADLPMEFDLRPSGELCARPPFALQSRDLALPLARMSVTFDLTGGRDV